MTFRYVNSSLDYRIVNLAEDWRLVNSDARLPPDFPTTPVPMSATVTSFSPTWVSVTNSMKRQVRTRGVQMWQIDLMYGAMTRANFAALWSFLVTRGGQSDSFTVSLPGLGTPRGTAAGTPKVNGGAQTGTSLITDGWSFSSAILKKGDFIEVENDRKVYMVTEDVSSNGAGQATIPIYPALRKVPGDNTEVFTSVVFTCALASDLLPVDFDQCLNARGFDLSLVEVLS